MLINQFSPYKKAEQDFVELLNDEDLDAKLFIETHIANFFKEKIYSALDEAFSKDDEAAHLFIQRCLYRINRLKLFWYDELNNYSNENSLFLFDLRTKIEKKWSAWEDNQISIESLKKEDVFQALCDRTSEDLNPDLTEEGYYIRDHICEAGYRHLLSIASLDGLVEASQLSRVLGGAGSEVQLMLTKILWEEYGGGKFSNKHSSHFAAMMEELGLDSKPETYFEMVPWEVLANINHSFSLSEQKRKFLRYVGGLLFIEISVPASFKNNKLAGERLGLNSKATSYWGIHIKEDIRHGQWMLNDVALPLIDMYKENAWEILLGYDQQKFISTRATSSIVDSIHKAKSNSLIMNEKTESLI